LKNSELMLLQLITIYKNISGYEINKYVINAEYHKWANIGQTSIYTGLRALQKKKYIISELALEKQGKGPLPYKFKITSTGKTALHKEMLDILSRSRENNVKFRLVLSAIQLIEPAEAVEALKHRITFLKSEYNRISDEFIDRAECLEQGPNFLYQHILHSSIQQHIHYHYQ